MKSANNKWHDIKLKYLSQINSETLGEDTDPSLDINYIDIGNVNSSGQVLEIAKYSFEEAPSRARRVIRSKDTIISTVRTYLQAIAHIDFAPDNLIASTGFAVVRPIHGKLYEGFCKYALRSQYFLNEVQKRSVGVAYPAINSSEIGDITIAIPPSYKYQAAISSYLDRETSRIDAMILAKENLLKLLEEKKQALITKAVTRGLDPNVKMKDSGIEWIGAIPEHWELKKLKYAGDIVLGKMLTNEDKGNYQLKPYLRAANISWHNPDLSDVKEMWFSETELEKLKLKRNDILVSEGGDVGRACIWQDELSECYIQNSVHKVTLRHNNDSYYFLCQFVLMGNAGFFLSIVNRISIAHLTVEKLKDVEFIVPPDDEQKSIASFLKRYTDKMTLAISSIQDSIRLLKERRSALITQTVTGQNGDLYAN